MVVHWETSLKPLFVKTVWIDGRRHAILSKDDPMALAITPIVSAVQTRTQRTISPAFSTTTSTAESPRLVLNANPLNLRNWERQKTAATCCPDTYKIERHCYTAGKTEDIIIDRNPLSDRVMQWLDLAGREDIKQGIEETKHYLAQYNIPEVQTSMQFVEQIPENTNRKAQQRLNKKQAQNRHKKYYKIDSDDGQQNVGQSFDYPISYVSDNIQNYVKKTNGVGTKDTCFSTRMSLSANIISFQDDSANNSSGSENKSLKNKKIIKRLSSTPTLSLALRQSNDKSNENNFKSEKISDSIESQYIEIIRKKMSEANYNIKASRRQLHIFIPSLPKAAYDSKTSSVIAVDDT